MGLAWGLVALVVFLATCMPGVGWQDSGIHQYRIVTGQLGHTGGLALCHPTHFWLGRAVLQLPLPLGEPAYRLNLISVVFGAAGVGLVAAVVASVTHNRVAASLAAAAVLLSHSYWQMSVVTEVYAGSVGLMALEWYLLLRYTQQRRPLLLIAVFAVNGLHFGVHQFALLTLVTYGVLALERVWNGKLRPGWLAVAAAVWLVMALPNWLMVWDDYQQTQDLRASLHSLLFGTGWAGDVLNTSITWKQLTFAGLSLGYCFPSVVLPVALVEMCRPAQGRRRVFRRVLLAQTIIIGAFVMRYPVVDLHTFFVPVCALVGLWFGLGVDRLLRGLHRQSARRWVAGLLFVNALLPLAVYLYFPVLARERGWMGSRMRDVPFRDEYAYFFRPWRCGDRTATLFARDAFARVGAGGWLLADSTGAPAASYTYGRAGGPEGLRVYSERICLNVTDCSELTPEAVTDYLRRGGRVLVMAGKKAEAVWGPHFAFDKRDPYYWRIVPDIAP